MLKMVVLPAPFGPITPLMSPSGISNDASCTARRPRKDLLTARTSRSALIAAASARASARCRAAGTSPPRAAPAVEHLLDSRDLPAEGREGFGDAVGEQRQP